MDRDEILPENLAALLTGECSHMSFETPIRILEEIK